MKTLFAVFAFVILLMVSPAFACDAAGSAEDCPDTFHDEPGHVTFCTVDGICCDYNGCSGSWLRSLPVLDVRLPDLDFPEAGNEQPASN